MGWIIFSILMLAIVAGTFKLRLGTVTTEGDAYTRSTSKTALRWGGPGTPVIALGTLALWLFSTLLLSFAVVEAGQLGLVKTFSEYTGTMSPGLHLKAPYQSVEKVNGRIQKATISLTGGEKGSAVSKETQPVYAQLVVNYRINLKESMQLYTEVGPDYYATIIEPVVQQSFKAITVEYSTVEIAPKREEIRERARKLIDDQLTKHGINVEDLLVKDLDFSGEFVKAIEDKQVATEQAKAAQERVATAKAEADAAREAAKGEADAIAIKGQALRQNPDSLQLSAIEKLNPNVQIMVVPDKGNMLLNLPSGGK